MTQQEYILQLEHQVSAWKETAEQELRNVDYYRSLLVRIGETFGEAARTQDDGRTVDHVLCAKVPELVESTIVELRQAVGLATTPYQPCRWT